MTNHEIFNAVWDHYISRDNPMSYKVIGEQIFPRYKNGERCFCPAGLFLGDFYSKELEGRIVTEEPLKSYFINKGIDVGTLTLFQIMHDNSASAGGRAASKAEFKQRLMQYKNEYL